MLHAKNKALELINIALGILAEENIIHQTQRKQVYTIVLNQIDDYKKAKDNGVEIL